MTSLNFTDHIKTHYGSVAAYEEETEDFQLHFYLQWKLAVCEEAGIPYSGWTANAENCARARKDHSAVHWLNELHNAARPTAFDRYMAFNAESLAYRLAGGLYD